MVSRGATRNVFGPVSHSADFVSDKGDVFRVCTGFLKMTNDGLLPLDITRASRWPRAVFCQANASGIKNREHEAGARQADACRTKQETPGFGIETIVGWAEGVRDASPVCAENLAAAGGDLTGTPRWDRWIIRRQASLGWLFFS